MIHDNIEYYDLNKIRQILGKQQSVLIELQDHINFTVPKLEKEIDDIKEENIKLNNTIYEQEKQIKLLNIKLYQCSNYNKSSYSELANRYNILNLEIQKIDTALNIILLQTPKIKIKK
jgi:septal ring factor EnvC (AmiA/AmiB activator)